MPQVSIGDLASRFLLRQQNLNLKQSLTQHAQELSSGRTSKPIAHLNGDISHLSLIETSLQKSTGFSQSLKSSALRANVLQQSLQSIADATADSAGKLMGADMSLSEPALTNLSSIATANMNAAISALNTSVAGQSLLSGSATDQSPVISASEILTELRTAIASETTLLGFETAIDTWFDQPGGGFETLAYQGNTNMAPPLVLSADRSIDQPLRADNQVFRDGLKSMAKAALATDQSFGFDTSIQAEAMTRAAASLFAVQNDLTTLQANLGVVEEQIEFETSKNSAQHSALESARNSLIGIDPYDSAAALEQTQTSLQSLYAVTARMSRLSLLEYL